MTAVKQLRKYIQRIPYGKPFSNVALRQYVSTDNARQILSRMVKSGEIVRVARGIFVRPKKVAYLGKTLPSAEKITKMIARSSNETIAIHGAEAARRLRLTTQTPMQPTFYTTGNTRHIKLSNLTITLKHISPKKLVAPGTIAGTVISALWYLGKDNVTPATINTIRKQLTIEQFNTVLDTIDHMPAWMANVIYHYQREKNHE